MQKLTIQIPKPCHERWEEMQPTEQGRFCASCQKTVVDYTTLSDQELVQLLNKTSGPICGRLRDDQLNRPITLTNPGSTFSWRRWIGMLTTALLSWKAAFAQFNSLGIPMKNALRPEISLSPIPIRGIGAETQWTISGRVMLVDASGNLTPAINAYVAITGASKGAYTQTDSLGRYSAIVSGQTQNMELSILANVPTLNRATATLEIVPSNRSVVVDDIVVSPVKLTSISISGGGIAIVQPPSRWRKLKRKLRW